MIIIILHIYFNFYNIYFDDYFAYTDNIPYITWYLGGDGHILSVIPSSHTWGGSCDSVMNTCVPYMALMKWMLSIPLQPLVCSFPSASSLSAQTSLQQGEFYFSHLSAYPQIMRYGRLAFSEFYMNETMLLSVLLSVIV